MIEQKNLKKEIPFLAWMPALVWQLFFIIIPLLIIIFASFTIVPPNTWTQHITLEHYSALFKIKYWYIISRSLVIAFATAVSCLILAYPVAYFLAFHTERWKNLFLFLLTLPFWTNFLVQIYAWYFVLERHGLLNMVLQKLHIINEPLVILNTLLGVYIVMVYCYLPFMIMPLYTSLSKMDVSLLEASADLGATPWQSFRRVTLPLSIAGIKTGFLLVLVPAFGELAIPMLMGGGKYFFVGSLISYFFLVVRDNPQGAAFTVLSGFILMIVALLIHTVVKRLIKGRSSV